jgi:hypothetical protein
MSKEQYATNAGPKVHRKCQGLWSLKKLALGSRTRHRDPAKLPAMTYVIGSACVDVVDKSCVQECPVDCIYEGLVRCTSTLTSAWIAVHAS